MISLRLLLLSFLVTVFCVSTVFMEQMIPHHWNAILMSRIALKHAEDAEGFNDEELNVPQLMRNIINVQVESPHPSVSPSTSLNTKTLTTVSFPLLADATNSANAGVARDLRGAHHRLPCRVMERQTDRRLPFLAGKGLSFFSSEK